MIGALGICGRLGSVLAGGPRLAVFAYGFFNCGNSLRSCFEAGSPGCDLLVVNLQLFGNLAVRPIRPCLQRSVYQPVFIFAGQMSAGEIF